MQLPKGPARVNVYGPKGIRKLIRTSLEITRPSIVDSREFFAVHEILLPKEEPSIGAQSENLGNEVCGGDIHPDEDGVWRDIVPEGSGAGQGWSVHAGPIVHRGKLSYVHAWFQLSIHSHVARLRIARTRPSSAAGH